MTRRRSTEAVKVPPVLAPPTVVTLDGAGEIVDMVGDLAAFVVEDETTQAVIQRLLDLVAGTGDHAEVLHAVELSRGRYADIHIVEEGDLRHFVLLDATEFMRTLQSNQQLSNEAALEQERERRALPRAPTQAQASRTGMAFRRSGGLFSAIVSEMREPLALLTGHAGILARHCRGDESAMRSIAAIQHAAVRLDALSSNSLIALGALSAGGSASGVVDLHQLAAFLQDAFALQIEAQGLSFEVFVPDNSGLVEINDLAFRQVLINLVVHALDGMAEGTLQLSLSATARHVDVEIDAEPAGFPAALFGPLITTSDVLQSNSMGSLALAVSQQILRRMAATVELVPRRNEGYAVWFRVPVRAFDRVQEKGGQPGIGVALAVHPGAMQGDIERMLSEVDVASAFPVGTWEQLEALARDGSVSAVVMSESFGEEAAEALLQRWRLAGYGPAMLIAQGVEPPRSGWLRDGNLIRVSANQDPQTLREALTALLAAIPRDRE